MIKRVRIRGYKSLKDVELRLQPLSVIFGPNASGKSNLFDALGLLSRMATSATIKDAFKDHRGAPLEAFFVEQGGIEQLLERSTADFTIEVDIALSPIVIDYTEKVIRDMREGLPRSERRRVSEKFLRYKATVQLITASGHLRVLDERLTALTQQGRERKRTPFLEKQEGKLRLRLEGQGHSTYHDVGLDHTLVSTPLYPPHYPHIAAFREELSRWRFYYFDPRAMREETPLKDVDTIGPFGSDLAAFYHTLSIKNEREFQTICRTLPEVLPAARTLQTERTKEGFVRLNLVEGDVAFSSRVMSEGTLRVLGLLAILHRHSPTTTIGFEEPENGVHPRRLRQIVRLLESAVNIGQKQLIINTHSPLVPDYFPNESLIVCEKREQKTTFTPFTSLGPMFRPGEIQEALTEDGGKPTPIFERIIRGDFGG